jgi:double-strand break repair protein MRE11
VATLVNEYLAAQELQLLGETGMSDAIQMFVEKDDTHAIGTYVAMRVRRSCLWLILFFGYSHVTKALKALMKDVQADEDVDEDELEDMVQCLLSPYPSDLIHGLQLVKAKEQQEKEYLEKAKESRAAKTKVTVAHVF